MTMSVINMLDAKTHLSRLVEAVETGAEAEIIIARNGRPVARLVAIARAAPGARIGVAKGRFKAPDPDAALDAEAAALFRKSK